MKNSTGTSARAILIGCLAVTVLDAQATAPASLLVLAKGDLTLSIVDPTTLEVLGRVPSGPDPHEVVASPDGRTAYISNYNGGGNIITVVDLVSRKALAPIDLGPLRAPHGLTFVGGKLWFTAEGAKVIGSYDPVSRKVDWVLGTGQNRTHMIVVSPDLQHMITTNVSSATVTFIEKTAGGGRGGPGGPPPASRGVGPGRPGGPGGPGGGPQSDWDETIVAVGRGAEGFDLSPDGREVWVANAQDGTVSIVDATTKRVTQTLTANVGGANRLKFTPDGTRVLMSGSDLIILDAATRSVVQRLAIGRGAVGIQIQPDGARAYVASGGDDSVAVIDLKSMQVTSHIAAGRGPDGLAWTVRR
jgi:YVTN family beta-propeller protein